MVGKNAALVTTTSAAQVIVQVEDTPRRCRAGGMSKRAKSPTKGWHDKVGAEKPTYLPIFRQVCFPS
jgi:hypothetical protein